MAFWEEGSCDLKFVDSKASKEFNCSICLSLAVQPRLNPSCGHHYCRPCTEKLVGKGQPCPECKADITNPVPDLYFERKMKQLKVQCISSKDGCNWIGKLAELQNHLECCRAVPGNFSKWVRQKDEEIAALKKRLEAAEERSRVAEEKVQRLEKQFTLSSGVATPEFVMTNFEEHKANKDNDDWYSAPFYSHIGGYKMYLRVRANGQATGKGTHVSVYIHMMQGENDDHLEWPFRGSITMKLLNHRVVGGSLDFTVTSTNTVFNATARRVVGRLRGETGIGWPRYIAHSDLPYNSTKNTEYLVNDSLTFRVATKVNS